LSDRTSSLNEVNSRRDLIQVMELSMMASAEAMSKKRRYAAGRNPVKSFLIESNIELGALENLDGSVNVQIRGTRDSTKSSCQSAEGRESQPSRQKLQLRSWNVLLRK
jgi:hypothetical protein